MGISKKAATQLKALREHNGMSVQVFADRIGMKRQAVSRWELGGTTLTMKSFDLICERLGIDPEKLMCGSPKIKLEPKGENPKP